MKPIKIKTKRLQNAIQKYFDFQFELYHDHNMDGTCPSYLQENYDNIKQYICDAARQENKHVAIVPKTIFITEVTPTGKKKSNKINTISNFQTTEWDIE